MRNIHDPATLNELLGRLSQIKADTPRQWGKMDAAQMMAHCSNALESTLGDKPVKRELLGLLFGKLAKKSVTSDEPFRQGLPTAASFVIKDSPDFDKEKQRLMSLITRLSKTSPEVITKNTHPFFGKMTAEEWNMLNYKHLDHHLRQFGA